MHSAQSRRLSQLRLESPAMRKQSKALLTCLSLSSVSSFRISLESAGFVGTRKSSQRSVPRSRCSVVAAMSNSNNQNGLLVSNIQHLGEDKIHLILASQSPRRREILDMLGLTGRYTAIPSPLDESALQLRLANELVSPLDYTRTLAEKKAEALAMHLSQDCSTSSTKSTLVLGSDTIVDLDDLILEKPADAQSARTMLRRLSGVWHRVHTGVAIYHVEADTVKLMSSFTDTAKVKFADLSEADINAYVETGEPMDKAGSYGIQGIGGQLVERMEGDFFTVMGLPMHLFSRELSKAITELTKSS